MKNITHIIGIDEAGRGPLAGPVAVGIVRIPIDFDWAILPGVADSKQLTANVREAMAERAHVLKEARVLDYCVSMVSARVIDRIGIVRAVFLGLRRGLERLNVDPQCSVIKLDGLLYAPENFTHQQTIIKGDETEKVIGLASIMAKVTRDDYMVRKAKAYPAYAFERHKGYGTVVHRRAIREYGLCDLHRRGFCRFAQEGYLL